MKIRQIAAQSIPAILFALPLAALDLTQAVVVAPASLDGAANKAVRSLVEEVEKRTAVRLPVGQSWPSDGAPAIAVGPLAKAREFAGEFARDLASADKPGAEGYVMRTGDNAVVIGGADPRGVLFGVGHLLRKLEMRAGRHPPAASSQPEHNAPDRPARPPARIPPEDEFLRRLDGRHVGAVHPRAGAFRRERHRDHSAALRRRCRQPPFPAAADRHDG